MVTHVKDQNYITNRLSSKLEENGFKVSSREKSDIGSKYYTKVLSGHKLSRKKLIIK